MKPGSKTFTEAVSFLWMLGSVEKLLGIAGKVDASLQKEQQRILWSWNNFCETPYGRGILKKVRDAEYAGGCSIT